MKELISRRWFQLHLSTAILVMIAAGGLLGLNVRPQTEDYVTWVLIDNLANPSMSQHVFLEHVQDHFFGWPFTAKWQSVTAYDPKLHNSAFEFDDLHDLSNSINSVGNYWKLDWEQFLKRAPKIASRISCDFDSSRCDRKKGPWDWDSILFDGFTGVGVLAVVVFACEWYVRRG